MSLEAVLMAWAVSLSAGTYTAPPEPPRIVYMPQADMQRVVCPRQKCPVRGIYLANGGEYVYIDNRLDPATDSYAASIVVHEMVHYLQHRAGRIHEGVGCAERVLAEREAYAVQQQYLVEQGVYLLVGLSLADASCDN